MTVILTIISFILIIKLIDWCIDLYIGLPFLKLLEKWCDKDNKK